MKIVRCFVCYKILPNRGIYDLNPEIHLRRASRSSYRCSGGRMNMDREDQKLFAGLVVVGFIVGAAILYVTASPAWGYPIVFITTCASSWAGIELHKGWERSKQP